MSNALLASFIRSTTEILGESSERTRGMQDHATAAAHLRGAISAAIMCLEMDANRLEELEASNGTHLSLA